MCTKRFRSKRARIRGQSKDNVVINHDDDLEALAVGGHQTFKAVLGQDCGTPLINGVIDALLQNEELALGCDGAFIRQSHPLAEFAQELGRATSLARRRASRFCQAMTRFLWISPSKIHAV